MFLSLMPEWCEEMVKTVNSDCENVHGAQNKQNKTRKFVHKSHKKYLDFHREMVYNISYRARFVERRTLMKKDYMKPEGKVVAMSVRENIATSEGTASDDVKVHYTLNATDGTKYIQGSDIPATSTGNTSFDVFYDMVKTYLHNLANCRVED